MKLQYAILLGAALMSISSFSQSFQQTLSQGTTEFNHYSIETASNGDYISAGTLFHAGGNQDIHIFRTNSNGTVLWEQIIDNSMDDRAFDVLEDPYGNIVVTGYTGDALDSAALYVLKLTSTGGFIADKIVTSFYTSAGTNIIFSQSQNAYIVGGLNADKWTYGLNDNHALILEFSLGLNVNWMHSYYNVNEMHSSINDIVEIPGGYFITGSIDFTASPVNDQGVLAAFIDYSGLVNHNLSFHFTNSEHVGVSAVYIANENSIYLMSNNSVRHNPQITQIDGVSSIPAISNNYYLELDPYYGSYPLSKTNGKGSNAAGFQLVESLTDPGNLVAAGYFREHDFGGVSPNTTPWIVEFDKKTGGAQWAYFHQSISPLFYLHGGGTFSTFSGEHPYIFNQEILTPRSDLNGYTFLASRTVDGYFGLDMVAINATGQSGQSSCLYDYTYNPVAVSFNSIDLLDYMVFISDQPVNAIPYAIQSNVSYDCYVSAKKEANNSNSLESKGLNLSASPNPFKDVFQLNLENKSVNGDLTILNARGEFVYHKSGIKGNNLSLQINLSDYAQGIYLLHFSDGITHFNKKIIKQ